MDNTDTDNQEIDPYYSLIEISSNLLIILIQNWWSSYTRPALLLAD